MDKEPRVKKPDVTRRNLLKAGAAGVLGTAAASAISVSPASADDGDPIILGQDNFASSPTGIHTQDFQRSLLIFPGSAGTILQAATADPGPVIFGWSFAGGPGVLGSSHEFGVIGQGDFAGVMGHSTYGNAIGVNGRTDVGTGVKAEVTELQEGTALEAVGPVKFSTSGLADVGASTDRATVDPGVPITSQSKVLATLQGNAGNKAMVEHVELDPAADTFAIVLTRPPMRAVQVAWFLIS